MRSGDGRAARRSALRRRAHPRVALALLRALFADRPPQDVLFRHRRLDFGRVALQQPHATQRRVRRVSVSQLEQRRALLLQQDLELVRVHLHQETARWCARYRARGQRHRERPHEAEHLLTLISLGLYLFTLGLDSNTSREVDRLRPEKTKTGEWLSSIVFAIVAATLVHTYFMQPYAIPTPSLERTLRVGDFLLVSKFHYGARIPTTAIAAPMMHDTVPILKVKSYLKTPQLPYFRLPGFTTVKKNDLVVFNWPADTVRQFFVKEAGVKKPIDKKSNYVKRCVGTPGDTLEVRDGFVYINGERLQLDSRAKPMYNHKIYASSGVS